MPVCVAGIATRPPTLIPNFLTSSSSTPASPFPATNCFYGNVSAVESLDPGNTFGIPLGWIGLEATTNVYVVTNSIGLTYPDPYSGTPEFQPGLVACDSIVGFCQSGAVNPNFFLQSNGLIAQIDL